MAAAVIAVRSVLLGKLHPFFLLPIEVLLGMVVYLASMLVFERDLLREVATVAFQAIPGGDRIAALFGIKVEARRRGGKGGAGLGRGRNKRTEQRAAVAEAEAHEVDMGMDIAADLGVDEARTADI